MKWISTKDRLPGKNQSEVIVYKENYTPQIAYFIHTESCYYFCIGNDVKQTWEPDYWMPLVLPTHDQDKLGEQESNEKHCDNCICSCGCRIFDLEHSDYCNVKAKK